VLNGALEERDAGFAILLVTSDEKVPAGHELLHEYEGDKMIVSLDKETLDPRPLELAYRYARCRCLMMLESELEVDAAGVRTAAEEALSALREALDAMVARVQASIERVEALVGTGEPEPEE
jgi:hypothetical protein